MRIKNDFTAQMVSFIIAAIITFGGALWGIHWLKTNYSHPQQQPNGTVQLQQPNGDDQSGSVQLPISVSSNTTTIPQSLTQDQYNNGHWHTVYNNGVFGVGMWNADNKAFRMMDGSPDVYPGPNVVVYAHVDETALVAGSWYWECSIPNYAIKFVGGTKVEGNTCFTGQFQSYSTNRGYMFTTKNGETIILESTHGGFPVINP